MEEKAPLCHGLSTEPVPWVTRVLLPLWSALCTVLAGDQYCGGRLEKPSGSFQTPNWPERDYPAGVTCSWHIVAPKNQVRGCHCPPVRPGCHHLHRLTPHQQPARTARCPPCTETTKPQFDWNLSWVCARSTGHLPSSDSRFPLIWYLPRSSDSCAFSAARVRFYALVLSPKFNF